MDFIICTPQVNRYGYRILPEGVRLDNFKKNPVALWMHEYDDVPVGRWENLRLENGNLVATIAWSNEEDAQKLRRLAEEGVISATSMGHDPISWTEDDTFLLQGQTRPTVTETELLEISFVTVPGNPGAVRLNLSNNQGVDDILPILSKKSDKMDKKILEALGLPDGAGVDAALSAINKIKTTAAEVETLRNQAIASLLAVGESKGMVTDANREHYKKLASVDFGTVQALFGTALAAPAQPEKPADKPAATEAQKEVSLTALIAEVQKLNKNNQPGDSRDDWNFDKWSKEDPEGLLKLRKENPEKYSKLAKAKAKEAGAIVG